MAPDNLEDEPRDCRESPGVPLGSCSKDSSNCYVGGRRLMGKFMGLNENRKSVRVLIFQKAQMLLDGFKGVF